MINDTAIVVSTPRLYSCDIITDDIYEHDLDTLAVINTVSAPSTNPTGIGGVGSDRLYSCDSFSDDIYEHDLDTLAVLNTVSTPSTTPTGIGGV
jgi:hypothetical protein